MRIFLFVLFLLLGAKSFTQSHREILVAVQTTIDKEQLILEKWYPLNEIDSFLVENFKFYLSHVELFNKGKLTFKETNSYHLLDFSESSKSQFSINVPEKTSYDEIHFLLGIDSLTNASGVKGGELDPTKGMYWTWQTGYINLKLEGKSNVCSTRNNAFTFHLGGFLDDYNAVQLCSFKIEKSTLDLHFDLKKLFQQIDLETQNHLMSPSVDAVKLSSKIATLLILQ